MDHQSPVFTKPEGHVEWSQYYFESNFDLRAAWFPGPFSVLTSLQTGSQTEQVLIHEPNGGEEERIVSIPNSIFIFSKVW